MQKTSLNSNDTFLVRESTSLNYITAALCWLVLIVLIATYTNEFTSLQTFISAIMALFVLAAAISFTLKAAKKKELIRMNSDGFYYQKKLITTWHNLESAQVTEENKMFTVKDNFVLILTYSREEGSYIRKIALTNTQDKSEEEILTAIRFYGGVTKVSKT